MLWRGGIAADELPKYNYVLAEMDRLNGEAASKVIMPRAVEGGGLETRLHDANWSGPRGFEESRCRLQEFLALHGD